MTLGHIAFTDSLLETLPEKCLIAIRQRYINKGQIVYFSNKKDFRFWIGKAERELI